MRRRILAWTAAAAVALALAGSAAAGHMFTDVPDDHTHANGIEWAADNGLMQGSGGTFAPEEGLTRAQFATVLKRYHSWVATSTTTTSTSVSSTTSSQPTTTVTSSTTSTLPATTTTQPTTTTTEATTTTTSSGLGFENVGVIGCSNVRQMVEGYDDQTTEGNLINTAQDAAVMSEWAEADTDEWPWSLYLAQRPAGGYDALWMVFCEFGDDYPGGDGDGLDFGDLAAIATQVRDIDPGLPIIVSPMHRFPNELCDLTDGNEIAIAGEAIVEDLLDPNSGSHDPGSIRGPVTGPLQVVHIEDNWADDDCHLNDSGEAFTGSQLVDFFD